MLVIAIIGSLMVMAINYGTQQSIQLRINKTVAQMQQGLTAGLAYYTTHGAWPTATCKFSSTSTTNSTAWSDLSTLTSAGFLPSYMSGTTANAYGQKFWMTCDKVTNNVFYINTNVSSHTLALAISGALPTAYTSDNFGNPLTTGTYVTAQVVTPAQNLNNARSVNFGGVYHHGACVPVPICPGYDVTTQGCKGGGTNCMTPQIMVTPVSVSGAMNMQYGNTPAGGNVFSLYPITSFTAYATNLAIQPNDCDTNSTATTCTLGAAGVAPNYTNPLYWRVCLQVRTQNGNGTVNTAPNNTDAANPPTWSWAQTASLMVITRCAPPSEPSGSDFTVFTN